MSRIPREPVSFGDLVHLTVATIQRRGALYRNTVVAVSMAIVLSLIASVAFRSWKPLLGCMTVLPITALFLLLDIRLVKRWQDRVLERWIEGAIDLHRFRLAVAEIKHLPAATVHGMLTRLSGSHTGPADAQRTRAERLVEAGRLRVRARRDLGSAAAWLAALLLVSAGVWAAAAPW
jgi:hypothetical protein